MANSDLYIKRASIVALKAAAGVTALVPAGSIFPIQRPSGAPWPFIGHGVPISEPWRVSCANGSACSFAIHNYAETTGEGVDTKAGEDSAMAVNAAVEAALDGAEIDLTAHGCPYPAVAHYTCTGSQVMQDGSEADKFHGFVSFLVNVIS